MTLQVCYRGQTTTKDKETWARNQHDRYLAVCRPFGSGAGGRAKLGGPLSVNSARCLVTTLAVVSVLYNVPRFFEYQRVEVCVPGVNATRVGFEITEFGAHLLYRIVYANVLYFVVVHGGPLMALGFFNVRLVQAMRRRLDPQNQ